MLFNSVFENSFPFAYEYFNTLLECVFEKKRKFPQAIIFEGSDTVKQYLFALELARILNCNNEKKQNCACINCNWIKDFSHPSIVNVSQIHFKPDNDDSKTVISVKQAREIENVLKLSSDYHRFFIFFSSSNMDTLEEDEKKLFSDLGYKNDLQYSIEPLEYKTFQNATLNILLKSIEEPPENTTFVFLTRTRENILPTIVSRCQVFKLSSKTNSKSRNINFDFNFMYSKIKPDSIFDILEQIQKFLKEEMYEMEIFLNEFLNFLKDLLIANISNNEASEKIKRDIFIVNQAIKYSKASIQDRIVLESMLFKIIRGY